MPQTVLIINQFVQRYARYNVSAVTVPSTAILLIGCHKKIMAGSGFETVRVLA